MMKAWSCAGQAEVVTRGTKRCTKELLKSITTIAEQPTPKKKPKQCRLPRSYRPRVLTANTDTSRNSDSTSPTTKQPFNRSRSSTSTQCPISPIPLRTPPTPITTQPHHISASHPSRTRKLIPLPSSLTRKHTRLSPSSHALLLKKASHLSQYEPLVIPRSFRRLKKTTVDATLAFAQYEAGTAFCIREDGLLLTAAHCITGTGRAVGSVVWLVMPAGEGDGEDGKEWWGWWKVGEEDGEEDDEGSGAKGGRGGLGREKERESSRSRIVRARCIALDLGRDLALLKVTHAQALQEEGGLSAAGKTTSGKMTKSSCKRNGMGMGNFPCVKLPPPSLESESGKPWKEPPLNTPLVAIGHPADEHPLDPPGVKAYGAEHRRVLQLSSGRYFGIAPDKVENPQDNSDTGAMQHDCWTYWGYSGGPVFERDSGTLVGVHVAWSPEEPLVKRAVPWCAVEGFLEENGFWS